MSAADPMPAADAFGLLCQGLAVAAVVRTAFDRLHPGASQTAGAAVAAAAVAAMLLVPVGGASLAMHLRAVVGDPAAVTAVLLALAAFAPTVLTVAADGDLRANAICTLAAEELVLHVRTLARQLFVDERAAIPVALSGGMLGRGGFLRRLVEHRLKHAVPGCHLKGDQVRAARGAAAMARSRAKAAR